MATLDTVVTVPFQGLPTPGPSSPVAVSSDLDRIAVAFRDGSGEILVFDGRGELLRRFGRAGQGPGGEPELRRVDPGLSETEVLAYHAPFLDAAPENAERWAQLIDTRPAVLEMTEDAEGDLWIRFGVPADPLPAVDDPRRALAEGEFGAEDLARTVLARFDSGALDRGPSDEFEMGPGRGGLLPGGLAYYFDPDELGEITMTLVRLGSRG